MSSDHSTTSFDESYRVDGGELRWMHFGLEEDVPEPLLAQGVPETVADALVISAARPRASKTDDGTIIVLRGINLSPGADPEDMVGVRMWLTEERLVTVCLRRVFAIGDAQAALRTTPPGSTAAIVSVIATALVDRMEPLIDRLDDQMGEAEERVLAHDFGDLQSTVSQLRRTIARMRRHLAPQRDAVQRLQRDPSPMWDEQELAVLREVGDRTMRYVEDLDAMRERALVIRDEIEHNAASATNRNTYLLGVVAAVFLPLGFLTGLLGINVGGMPGTNYEYAFWAVCGMLGVLTVVEVMLLRKLRIL